MYQYSKSLCTPEIIDIQELRGNASDYQCTINVDSKTEIQVELRHNASAIRTIVKTSPPCTSGSDRNDVCDPRKSCLDSLMFGNCDTKCRKQGPCDTKKPRDIYPAERASMRPSKVSKPLKSNPCVLQKKTPCEILKEYSPPKRSKTCDVPEMLNKLKKVPCAVRENNQLCEDERQRQCRAALCREGRYGKEPRSAESTFDGSYDTDCPCTPRGAVDVGKCDKCGHKYDRKQDRYDECAGRQHKRDRCDTHDERSERHGTRDRHASRGTCQEAARSTCPPDPCAPYRSLTGDRHDKRDRKSSVHEGRYLRGEKCDNYRTDKRDTREGRHDKYDRRCDNRYEGRDRVDKHKRSHNPCSACGKRGTDKHTKDSRGGTRPCPEPKRGDPCEEICDPCTPTYSTGRGKHDKRGDNRNRKHQSRPCTPEPDPCTQTSSMRGKHGDKYDERCDPCAPELDPCALEPDPCASAAGKNNVCTKDNKDICEKSPSDLCQADLTTSADKCAILEGSLEANAAPPDTSSKSPSILADALDDVFKDSPEEPTTVAESVEITDETRKSLDIGPNDEVWIMAAPKSLGFNKLIGARLQTELEATDIGVKCTPREYSNERLVQVTASSGATKTLGAVGTIQVQTE